MSSWFRRASSSEPVVSAAAAQGKPLLLIGFNETSEQWEVGQEALRALQGIKGPLCTISVCGRARQGKSFMLNQMLGRFTGQDKFRGFTVSPTQQSCTRGIWMWSHPVQVPGPDGRKCNAVSGSAHSTGVFNPEERPSGLPAQAATIADAGHGGACLTSQCWLVLCASNHTSVT